MPITLTPFVQGALCYGSTWHISDEGELALLIARVLMGQYRHVAKILAGTGVGPVTSDAKIIESAITLLHVPPGKTRGIATDCCFRRFLGSLRIAALPLARSSGRLI